MTYTTKRCPHCGKTYSFMQTGRRTEYGSPFRICHACSHSFVDKDYREIAIDGIHPIDKMKVSPGSVLQCFLPLGFVIVSLICGTLAGFDSGTVWLLVGDLIFLGLALWLVSRDIRSYKERIKWLEQEAIRSEARLSNPEYASALKRIGCRVPEKYLNQNGDSNG